MNRKIFTGILCMLALGSVSAQQSPKSKEKKEEVIIKSKKEGNEKMTIVIDGDKVTVNGKPVTEYKGDKVIIRHNDNDFEFKVPGEEDMARLHSDMAKMERDMARQFSQQKREFDRMKIRRYPGPGYNDFNFDFNFEGLPEMRAMAEVKPRTHLGVSLDKADKGVKVTDVDNESPASKAGLKEGDIITKFNGKAVTEPQDLATMVREKKPGDEVEITYLPTGTKKEKKIKVKLGETKGQAFAIRTPAPKAYRVYPDSRSWEREFNDDMFRQPPGAQFYKYENRRPMFGIRIQDTEDSSGVKVLDVDEGSLAATAGVQENDIITQIDGKPVKDTDAAREALQDAREKNQYSVNLKRNGTPMTLQVKVPVKLKKAEL